MRGRLPTETQLFPFVLGGAEDGAAADAEGPGSLSAPLPAYATPRYLLLGGIGDDLARYVTRLGIRG